MEEEYIPVAEAKRRLGLSDPAFARRVRRGEIVTYRDPCDWRRRVVQRVDLDRYLATMKPIRGQGGLDDAA